VDKIVEPLIIGHSILYYYIIENLGEEGMFHNPTRIKRNEWIVILIIPKSNAKSKAK
jgi:hypothetical protein